MKVSKLSVLFLTAALPSLVARADEIKITCDQARSISRAESVKQVQYRLDPQRSVGAVTCSTRCPSIRLDLSKFLGATAVDNSRQAFSFLITQEDEFDNLVT